MASNRSYQRTRKKRSPRARSQYPSSISTFFPPLKKKTKKRKRKKASGLRRKIDYFVFAFVSVTLCTILLLGFSVFKFINAPFSSAHLTDYGDTNKVWEKDQVTLALLRVDDVNNRFSDIQDLVIINFDVPSKRYQVYYLPVDVEVEYAMNYGSGPLRRVYAVGNTDQNRGVYLLEKTLLKLLAVKIDGYVIIDQAGFSRVDELAGKINPDDLSAVLRLRNTAKIPKMLSAFRESTITNLKISDVKDVILFIRNTSDASSSVIRLNKYHILEPEKWDNIWRDNVQVSEVRKEYVKIFVANASDPKIPGLASWGARVSRNLGIDVFEVKNSLVSVNENTIITSDPSLVTVEKIAKALDIKKIISIDELENPDKYNPEIFRTDVTLLVSDF